MRTGRIIAAVAILIGAWTTMGAMPAGGQAAFTDPPPRQGPSFADPDRAADLRAFLHGSPSSAGATASQAITVTPDTDLVDGQAVQVDGSGFDGDILVGIFQCAMGKGIDGCDIATVTLFEPGGDTFRETQSVRAILDTNAGTIDCRTYVSGCRLVAHDTYSLAGAARATITFDPDGPLEPDPTISVDPDTDLVDGQTVGLTGTGFHRNRYVDLLQCAAGGTPADPASRCGNFGRTDADAEGKIDTDYRVEAVFEPLPPTADGETDPPPGPSPVDCRAEPCDLVAISGDDPGHSGSAPLHFDPDGPLSPPMTLQVVPHDDLVDGQEVDVEITGFTRDGRIDVVECTLISQCDFAGVRQLTADGTGGASTEFTVREAFASQNGPVDCLADRCILVAFDGAVTPAERSSYLFEYLNFAGDTSPPDDPGGPDPIPMEPRFTG